MHLIKLCLVVASLLALLITLFAPVASAQSGSRYTVQRPKMPQRACYERQLVQGSGNVRICG